MTQVRDLGVGYEGLVNVYYGSQFGLSHTPGIVLRGNQVMAHMGTGCPIVGDINGDGYDDLLIGAEGYSEGEAGEGHAFLYLRGLVGSKSDNRNVLGLRRIAQSADGLADALAGGDQIGEHQHGLFLPGACR